MVRTMQVVLAMGVLAVLGLSIAAGIVLAVKGSAWLLILSSLVYLILFARVGCKEA